MTAKPLATGTLQKTPFAHLLLYLDQNSMSGTLAVWPDGSPEAGQGQDRLLLLKGKIVGGRFLGPATDLTSGVLEVFSRNSAPYAFYEGNLLGEGAGRFTGRLDPLSLVATWLRGDTARDDLVAATLGRVGNAVLSLNSEMDASRFDFDDQEYSLVQRLSTVPATVEQLAGAGELEPMRALRVLYLLVISKAVKVRAAAVAPASVPRPTAAIPVPPPAATRGAPPAPPPAVATLSAPPPPPVYNHSAVLPDSAPPAQPTEGGASEDPPKTGMIDGSRLASIPPPEDGLNDEHRKQWLKIVARGKLIENQTYFEMLGVSKTAKASEVRNEFIKVAKEWHPDRLPSELAALKSYVQSIFAYMTEASGCLGDEKQRLSYLQTVREGGGTPATDRLMQTILDSAMQFERVLVYTRQHAYQEALDLLEQILAVTVDEPDYHAMYAWILMQMYPNKPGVQAPLDEMLAAADRAIGLHAKNEKANLYKAQILRRQGKSREALEWFRKVVRINPNNLDAAREVRIAEMRGQSLRPGKKKEPSGILGKFFKR